MSAPLHLLPPPRSMRPSTARASIASRRASWPAPHPVALRRSNAWPQPSLHTLAWAESLFTTPVQLAAPTPPDLLELARRPLLPAPSTALAPPMPVATMMGLPLPPPTALRSAPVGLLRAAPSGVPAAAPLTTGFEPPTGHPLPAPRRADATPVSGLLAPPSAARPLITDDGGEPIIEATGGGRRRQLVVDAIVTVGVAFATALLTLFALSQF